MFGIHNPPAHQHSMQHTFKDLNVESFPFQPFYTFYACDAYFVSLQLDRVPEYGAVISNMSFACSLQKDALYARLVSSAPGHAQ